MLKRCVCVAILLLCANVASAGFIGEGLNLVELAPPLAAGSTTANVVAINPVNDDLWWSAGTSIHRLGAGNTWDAPIALNDVVPWGLTNYLTSRLTFDSAGRMYVSNYGTGAIFRSADDGAHWSYFSAVAKFTDDFHFDAEGNLIVLTANGDGFTAPDTVWKITPDGQVSQLGEILGRTFAFDASGNIVAPHTLGTGIDMLTPDGNRSTIVSLDRSNHPIFDSIAVTPDGNYLIGVTLGIDDNDPLERNRSEIIRVDSLGSETILVSNVGGPTYADMQWLGSTLYISGYGSLHALALTGDVDAPLVVTPEPSTLALSLVSLTALGLYRLRSRRLA